VSPLRQLGVTIAAEEAARQWGLINLLQSARPSGVVQATDQWLGMDKEERQTLLTQTRDDLRKAYAGPENAGKLPVLPPGLEWKTAEQTTAVEAALIEQRKANREEVAANYMLPPPMIGILDHATYSNVQQAREMAYTDGLAPPLVLIEQVFNAHVCRGLLRDPELFGEFDFAGILRGDRLKEIQAIREAISTAVLTPNEGRDLTGRPRSGAPEADLLYMPANNLKPIDNPDGNRLRDRALAAQQLSNASGGPVMDHGEARRELGLDEDDSADGADTQQEDAP
jgi:HK97 family phage portal protein